jgi:hypothetical protein
MRERNGAIACPGPGWSRERLHRQAGPARDRLRTQARGASAPGCASPRGRSWGHGPSGGATPSTGAMRRRRHRQSQHACHTFPLEVGRWIPSIRETLLSCHRSLLCRESAGAALRQSCPGPGGAWVRRRIAGRPGGTRREDSLVPAGLAAHPQNRVFSGAPTAGRIGNQRVRFLVVKTQEAESVHSGRAGCRAVRQRQRGVRAGCCPVAERSKYTDERGVCEGPVDESRASPNP